MAFLFEYVKCSSNPEKPLINGKLSNTYVIHSIGKGDVYVLFFGGHFFLLFFPFCNITVFASCELKVIFTCRLLVLQWGWVNLLCDIPRVVFHTKGSLCWESPAAAPRACSCGIPNGEWMSELFYFWGRGNGSHCRVHL